MSINIRENIVSLNSKRKIPAISWCTYKPGLKLPSIRRGDLSLHKPFQSFAFSVADNTNSEVKAFASRMNSVAYALLDYEIYLESVGLTWLDGSDGVLANYRNYAFAKVRNSKSSRGNLTAKKSVNIKIHVLYEFYSWASSSISELAPSIGTETHVAIKSTLPLHSLNPTHWTGQPRKLYPQCFTGVAESSASMSGQHWATVAEINDIEEYFRNVKFVKTGARNILFMRVIDQTGLRRESTNSLVIGQFSDKNIEKSISTLKIHSIQPYKQKNDERNFFDIPIPLSLEINRFIKSIYGDDIFVRAAKNVSINMLPLFVSEKTGAAMDDKSWTAIFTDAFNAIDAPKGAGVHAIRRKFAEDWFEKEVQNCIDKGQPISYADIVAGLAKVLGHDSKLSQEAYRRVSRMSRGTTTLDTLTEENRELAVRVIQLNSLLSCKDEEISRLRNMLEDVELSVKKKMGLIAKRPTSQRV